MEPLESTQHTDVYVAKLDAQGQAVWARQLSCTTCGANPSDGDKAVEALALTENAVVVGSFQGDFGSPGPCMDGLCAFPWAPAADPFVVLLARDGGATLDSVFTQGTGYTRAMRVVVDSAGDIVVAGIFSNDHDVTPLDPAGGSWLSVGSTDVFVLKLDAALEPIWHKRLGGVSTDGVAGLALDQEDNPMVVGHTGDELQGDSLFVHKLLRDSQVTGGGSTLEYPVADRLFDAAPSSSLQPVAAQVDSSGDLVITATLRGSASLDGHTLVAAGYSDAVVVKLDQSLATIWARSVGSDAEDMGMAMALDAEDSIFIGGASGGGVDLGDGPMLFGGQLDLFAAALNP